MSSDTRHRSSTSKQAHLRESNENIPYFISPTSKLVLEHKQLLNDMRAQNYDVIRFATYRTACKLRFIQRQTNLGLVDLWNIIEAFRQTTLNTMDPNSEINVTKLEAILGTLFTQLNKRLPANAQINAEKSIKMTLNWMINAYDHGHKGKIRVLAVKVCLSTMAAGKLMDKLRYIFMQITDANGCMIRSKFDDYLKHLLSLPAAVFEGPSFGYTEATSRTCFDGKIRVNVNDFLDTMMSDPGPKCLLWMPILHRMAQVENVLHPIQCDGCNRESFVGFRYKCQRCHTYNLCQDCFWRGRTSGSHSNEHSMKEYTSYKSPAKQIGHSLRKSFRCAPTKSNHKIPKFPETPEKTLDLSNIVPSTPGSVNSESRHHSNLSVSIDQDTISSKSPNKAQSSPNDSRIDDEHRLIARYAARLAANVQDKPTSHSEMNGNMQPGSSQVNIISQLESKNREIMQEIKRLRIEQQEHNRLAMSADDAETNPTLLAELKGLRQRKDELEDRMSNLQESRRDLMVQLENLMKLLKTNGSPRSSPSATPKTSLTRSPGKHPLGRGASPSTPGDSLMGVGGDVKQAFSQGRAGNVCSLRNDLLVAADSVTNAMSSLVKELNSEASSDEVSDEDDMENNSKAKNGNLSPTSPDDMSFERWQQEVQRRLGQESAFLAELQAKRDRKQSREKHSDSEYVTTDDCESFGQTDNESNLRTDEEGNTENEDAEMYDNPPQELMSSRYSNEEENYIQTSDAESYIRTDDEDQGNSEWEESMKRWVNR